MPLSSFVAPDTPDPIQHLSAELFVSMRSAISHAKSGRKVLVPQDDSERQRVTDSLRRLVGLYLKLAEEHLGARRAGGGMTAAAFRMMLSPTLEQMRMHVSDDESPFDKSDTNPNPAGGRMKELLAAGAADTSRSFVATRVWSERCADLTDLPFIRRVVGIVDDKPGIAAVLEGGLCLDPHIVLR